MCGRISKNRTRQISLTLSPVGPFDFSLSTGPTHRGDPHVARYNNRQFWQVLRIDDRLVHAAIRSVGSVAEPCLHVTLRGESVLGKETGEAAICCLSSVLNADLDVKPFYSAAKEDVLMTKLTNQLYGLKNMTTATVFEALICSIIEQQISLSVARSIEYNVIKAFGDSMAICGARYYVFPTTQQLAQAPVDTLRRCGLSRQKAEYITEIAKAIERGDLNIEKLKRCDDTQAILDILCSLRGVGLWTAELTALRGLNRLDAFPVADAGLECRWIAHYYCDGQTITRQHARQIAARWNKWKGLAGHYLITAGRLGVNA